MNRVSCVSNQVKPYQPTIVVMGSCFLDYIAYVDHMPVGGETMHSSSFMKGFGGKGANQAVAAGRVGADIAMVGMVGDDGDGHLYLNNLQRSGVNTSYVFAEKNNSTGVALIFVDTKSSQNEIVICPNATLKLTPAFVRQRTDNYNLVFTPSVKVLICQNEVPLDTTLDMLKAASERSIYTVFNAAPAPSSKQIELIKPFLQFVSLFCPNEVEAEGLTGIKVTSTESAIKAARALQNLGVKSVVITLGSAGFLLAEDGKAPVHVQSERVKAVDTTGSR
ncbi:ribokinase [Angomonas deanei]|nr:ribokinase [Angomonas deanei]|eukprot:EPY39174.1 ribokinase [Angomonas deanei]